MTTKSSAADRRRPTPWDFLVAAMVAGAAVGLLFFLRPGGGNFLQARVVLDGETIAQYDLTTLTEPVTLEVDDAPYPLTIQVEPGRIRVSEADCPDQVCVNQGFISDGTVPVVCLPHKLMIEIVGGGSEFDAAAG